MEKALSAQDNEDAENIARCFRNKKESADINMQDLSSERSSPTLLLSNKKGSNKSMTLKHFQKSQSIVDRSD